jgi:hypothetical protein
MKHMTLICGAAHPDLGDRSDIHGTEFTPVTCEAEGEYVMGVVIPHANKHRAHLGKHLIRWN